MKVCFSSNNKKEQIFAKILKNNSCYDILRKKLLLIMEEIYVKK